MKEKRFDTEENMSKKVIIAMDNYFTRPVHFQIFQLVDVKITTQSNSDDG